MSDDNAAGDVVVEVVVVGRAAGAGEKRVEGALAARVAGVAPWRVAVNVRTAQDDPGPPRALQPSPRPRLATLPSTTTTTTTSTSYVRCALG